MTVNDRDRLAHNDWSLTEQLKSKGRRRRAALARVAETSAAPRVLRNDPMPRLDLVYVPLSDLRMPARKLRNNDPAHIREIANAINELGFCVPVLVGKGNVVIDGEARVDAAKMLGLEHTPCIRIDHLTEAEQRTLRLAVNRLGEKGRWNPNTLKIEFEELMLAEAPIEISGFSLHEIDQIVLGEEPEAVETGPLAPADGARVVARLGDVFLLGAHRVLCGNATKAENIDLVVHGSIVGVRLILTDEPYNVRISGHVTGGAHREFAMASGEMSDKQFLEFNLDWMSAVVPHLSEGGVFGTFIDWRGNPIVHAAATKLGLVPLNLIVWAKTNAGMGSLYRSQHELLPLFKKGDAPHVNNINLGKKGRWRSNLWTYPGASSLGSDARRGLQEHPTVKPTAMLEDALLDLTHRGEIVLDPFLGSGSTLIAAERAGRKCYGVELDPLYVDVSIRRWEKATEMSAVLQETGESFGELSARRDREALDPAI